LVSKIVLTLRTFELLAALLRITLACTLSIAAAVVIPVIVVTPTIFGAAIILKS
jgi:hypothetical protein